ncbi:MAG: hypothetical protein LBR74_00570 [Eubacterium sp.]|jgi:hypothetical protein|nr:hypothetical protein [Eubacterium sp.]
MSSKRIELHNVLVEILGYPHVYFQPPNTVNMQYPCIVYARNAIETKHANDLPYNNRTSYSVTVIDSNPDSDFPIKISNLPLCKFERHYTADNLNHDVFNIYY